MGQPISSPPLELDDVGGSEGSVVPVAPVAPVVSPAPVGLVSVPVASVSAAPVPDSLADGPTQQAHSPTVSRPKCANLRGIPRLYGRTH